MSKAKTQMGSCLPPSLLHQWFVDLINLRRPAHSRVPMILSLVVTVMSAWLKMTMLLFAVRHFGVVAVGDTQTAVVWCVMSARFLSSEDLLMADISLSFGLEWLVLWCNYVPCKVSCDNDAKWGAGYILSGKWSPRSMARGGHLHNLLTFINWFRR